ncbi:MAG: hypothetical protein IJQ67_01625 [Bacilli bacterium]|nr:hypothetical protein [Bacilli bacterium]
MDHLKLRVLCLMLHSNLTNEDIHGREGVAMKEIVIVMVLLLLIILTLKD